MRGVILLVLIFAWFPSFLSADLLLTFDKTVQTSALEQTGKETKNERGKVTVYLGSEYIRIRDGGMEAIYDFARRRVFQVNRNGGTYTEVSLYAVVDFRVMELSNRVFLNRALDKAEIKTNKVNFDTALLEHHFSMRHPGSQVIIQKQERDKGVNFHSRSRELAFVTDDGEPLTPAESKMYIQFMRYHLGGHPVLLDALNVRARVPKMMKVVQYAVFERRETIYQLGQVEKYPVVHYDLAGLRREVPDGQKSEFVRWTVRSIEPGSQDRSSRELLSLVDSNLAAGRTLDAFLTLLEHSLQTGDGNADLLARHKAVWQLDPDVGRVMRALSAQDKKTGEVAVRTLQSLRARARSRQHVLYVFEANHHSALGNRKEAVKLFEMALKQNPRLVGAYKDIGVLYRSNYRTDMAWMCWDHARQLSPSHPLLRPIIAYEEKLVRDYPDFF